jgi:GST-like protein
MASSSTPRWTLYGSDGSGSAAVEIALQRCGLPFEVLRASAWEADSAQAELAQVNPLGQIPTLVSPSGEVLTESAAILAELGLRHPASALLPADAAGRARVLRGLVYVAANCYAAIGVIDYPERWTSGDEAALDALRAGARRRLHKLWLHFADQFHDATQPWLGGSQAGALDLLAAVVSRWSGARAHLKSRRPALHTLLENVATHPQHVAVWQRHFPSRS